MTRLGCPDHSDLRAFSRGTLREAVFEQVAQHFEECSSCEGLLEEFEDLAHHLLTRLRMANGDDPHCEETTPDRLLEGVRSLPIQSIRSRLSTGQKCRLGRFE